MKFLTSGGSVAAAILGAVVFGLGGLRWTVPMLAFFVPSSILSSLAQRARPQVALNFEKTGRRDVYQVLANGGTGGCLALLTLFLPEPSLYRLYLGSLAAVSADTWSTEIGVLVGGRTILATTLQPVEPGRSGGISAAGIIGGLAGGVVVALSGVWWAGESLPALLAVVTAAGLVGSLADSFLGATMQAQYKCTLCGGRTEKRHHCGTAAELSGGFGWFTNDLVNLLASWFGAAVMAAMRGM